MSGTDRTKSAPDVAGPVVILVDPHGEQFYQVEDPQLGDAEAVAVDAMRLALGGG